MFVQQFTEPLWQVRPPLLAVILIYKIRLIWGVRSSLRGWHQVISNMVVKLFQFFTFFDLSLLYSEPKDLFFFNLY